MADNSSGGGSSIDLATILGLLGAFGLIISAMVLGGSPGSSRDEANKKKQRKRQNKTKQ